VPVVVVDVVVVFRSPLFANRCYITIPSRNIVYAADDEAGDSFFSSFYICPAAVAGTRFVLV